MEAINVVRTSGVVLDRSKVSRVSQCWYQDVGATAENFVLPDSLGSTLPPLPPLVVVQDQRLEAGPKEGRLAAPLQELEALFNGGNVGILGLSELDLGDAKHRVKESQSQTSLKMPI